MFCKVFVKFSCFMIVLISLIWGACFSYVQKIKMKEGGIILDSDKEAGLISDSPVSESSSHFGYFVSPFKLKFLLVVYSNKKRKEKKIKMCL